MLFNTFVIRACGGGSNTKRVKSDTVLPTARQRCDIPLKGEELSASVKTRRWAPPICCSLQHNTASRMKNVILVLLYAYFVPKNTPRTPFSITLLLGWTSDKENEGNVHWVNGYRTKNDNVNLWWLNELKVGRTRLFWLIMITAKQKPIFSGMNCVLGITEQYVKS